MRMIITQNVTLDGRAEMLDDWFDPAAQDPDLAEEIMRQSAREEILLLGRRTFEDFRSYWPHAADDTTGVAAHLDAIDKWVVSSTLTDPGWQNSRVISGDPIDAVRALRAEPGGDVCLTGSLELAHAVIRAGLVDEYRMFVYPHWQGRGRGFFPDGVTVSQLQLSEARSVDSGVVYLSYVPVESVY
jgi:dihydrofolate reductase